MTGPEGGAWGAPSTPASGPPRWGAAETAITKSPSAVGRRSPPVALRLLPSAPADVGGPQGRNAHLPVTCPSPAKAPEARGRRGLQARSQASRQTRSEGCRHLHPSVAPPHSHLSFSVALPTSGRGEVFRVGFRPPTAPQLDSQPPAWSPASFTANFIRIDKQTGKRRPSGPRTLRWLPGKPRGGRIGKMTPEGGGLEMVMAGPGALPSSGPSTTVPAGTARARGDQPPGLCGAPRQGPKCPWEGTARGASRWRSQAQRRVGRRPFCSEGVWGPAESGASCGGPLHPWTGSAGGTQAKRTLILGSEPLTLDSRPAVRFCTWTSPGKQPTVCKVSHTYTRAHPPCLSFPICPP